MLQDYHTAIVIKSPVSGIWLFMNPPGHHPNAKDFVAVDGHGRPYSLLSFIRHIFWSLNVRDTFAWGKEVYAPFDGLIIEAENSCKDRETLNLARDFMKAMISGMTSRFTLKHHTTDINFFTGNHVIIQSDEGVYALFAHLRQDSVKVNQGDRVKTGEIIANVGNSGNTIQPHLHFHLMKENNLFVSKPLPFILYDFEIKEGSLWKFVRSALPKNLQVFRVI
ncbi:MAG: M23 family metallopeptidase [Nitrospirae bacterium]|nr:M23 family metallopeptidase [Nitrospirota bacterium]